MESSNSSSIIISFSIAILLLLVLLILISYNSKCKMDNIERFEMENETNFSQISDILKTNNHMPINSEARYDKPHLSVADGSTPLGNVYASNPSDTSYSSPALNGIPVKNNTNSIEENFVNNPSSTPSSTNNGYSTTCSSTDQNCFNRDRLKSTDLLPVDSGNSKWGEINPSGSGLLLDQNFLTSGYHIGINTIGQSLRNANLQLRSEPPNPQIPVSPWGISTIEPDIRTTAFEIGSGATN